jgi:hypothetical protein
MELLTCPNCGVSIVIESINCGIFRCGIYKLSNQQIDPHASKATIDRLLAGGEIHGCGQPFQLMVFPTDDKKTRLVKCEWI